MNSKPRTTTGILTAAGIALSCAGVALVSASPASADGADNTPESITLQAIVRDFRGNNEQNGHPDFEAYYGPERMGILENELDENGRPVLKSRTGYDISQRYYDNEGREINPWLFDASRGDREGSLTQNNSPRYASEASFNQWYRDVPGVNTSIVVDLELKRRPGTDLYVFDSARDEPYRSLGGFFPIDNQGFGNWMTNSRDGQYHNYHFTTELSTEFTYERGSDQNFEFSGDDDVWVFIDGRLVVDLGGLHSVRTQFLDLDRLDWLEDGVHSLTLFHAERRFRDSNFKIFTTLQLRPAALPTVAGMAD